MSKTPSKNPFSERYKTATEALAALEKNKASMDADVYSDIKRSIYEREYSPSSFDMGEFEGLLGKLEGSKMRQQRQKSVEGRRDIMTGGLAGMMSNF